MDAAGPPDIPGHQDRPFYGRFAWAYDLLSDRPVAAECAEIAAILGARGVRPGAALLDAGCGTGRHALELERHGYRVSGLDRSPELLAVARARPGAEAVTFVDGDLTALGDDGVYQAILCRGVLNDLVDDAARAAAFAAFARALVPGGVLVLDVRDWDTTVRRKTAEPTHERTVETARGRLTFRSLTALDHTSRRMLIMESHTLAAHGATIVVEHRFVMRCWTRDELDALLGASGFAAIEYRGAYDATTPAGATDRLIVIAARAAPSQRARG